MQKLSISSYFCDFHYVKKFAFFRLFTTLLGQTTFNLEQKIAKFLNNPNPLSCKGHQVLVLFPYTIFPQSSIITFQFYFYKAYTLISITVSFKLKLFVVLSILRIDRCRSIHVCLQLLPDYECQCMIISRSQIYEVTRCINLVCVLICHSMSDPEWMVEGRRQTIHISNGQRSTNQCV